MDPKCQLKEEGNQVYLNGWEQHFSGRPRSPRCRREMSCLEPDGVKKIQNVGLYLPEVDRRTSRD